MDTDYLFNRDNGMCYGFSNELAAARSDLIAITRGELADIISGKTIDDILSARCEVVKDCVNTAAFANAVTESAKKDDLRKVDVKGINFDNGNRRVFRKNGDDAKPVEMTPFGDEKPTMSYAEMRKHDIPFAPDRIGEIQDCDLHTFISDFLEADFGDVPSGPEVTEDEVKAWYDSARKFILRKLKKMEKCRMSSKVRKGG